jgi:uncharacterized membrane protein YfcA
MMICSIAVQSVSLVVLGKHLVWRGSLTLIVGGALGIPPALFLLRHADVTTFRVGFGVFLALYSAYMIFRPLAAGLRNTERRAHEAAIGLAGGLLGGLVTAVLTVCRANPRMEVPLWLVKSSIGSDCSERNLGTERPMTIAPPTMNASATEVER